MAKKKKYDVKEYEAPKGLAIWVVGSKKGNYDLYGAMKYASKRAKNAGTCINFQKNIGHSPVQKITPESAMELAREDRGY